MSSLTKSPRGLQEVRLDALPELKVLERRVEGSRDTVICVHGGLDRGGSFARVARRLNDCNVVAYDRRGYQGSRSLRPLDLQHHVEDLARLVSREKDQYRVLLFGHSLGGMVALATAIKYPQHLFGVVTFETSLPWILARPGAPRFVVDDPGLEAETFFRRVVSDGAWERLTTQEKLDRRADGPALVDDLLTLRGEPPFFMSELTVPLRYAYGDGPQASYYDLVVRRLVELTVDVTGQQILHTGHGAHLSRPEQVAQLLESAMS